MSGRRACWDGVTDYRITRFFGGSNRYGLTQRTRGSERKSESEKRITLCSRVSSVVKILTLPPELHGDARASGHVRSRGGRLLPRQPAADCFQFEASILRSFHRAAYSFAEE
jgi:hypothetical protein